MQQSGKVQGHKIPRSSFWMDCVSLDIFSWWNVQQKCVSAQPSVRLVSLNTRTDLPQTKMKFQVFILWDCIPFRMIFCHDGRLLHVCSRVSLCFHTTTRVKFCPVKTGHERTSRPTCRKWNKRVQLVTGFRTFLDPFVSNQTDDRAITRMATLSDCWDVS